MKPSNSQNKTIGNSVTKRLQSELMSLMVNFLF